MASIRSTCPDFLKNACKFGDGCRMLHVAPRSAFATKKQVTTVIKDMGRGALDELGRDLTTEGLMTREMRGVIAVMTVTTVTTVTTAMGMMMPAGAGAADGGGGRAVTVFVECISPPDGPRCLRPRRRRPHLPPLPQGQLQVRRQVQQVPQQGAPCELGHQRHGRGAVLAGRQLLVPP